MPNIRDVAEKAHVSVTTVSHVINGTRFVEPKTIERVQQAIAELGYRPNSLARSLRRGETRTIGLLIPDNSNPFFAEVARVVEDAGFNEGYSVILCNSDMSDEKEEAYLEVLFSKQVDGLILISSSNHPERLERLHAARVPLVIVDRELGLSVDKVLVDNEQGGYLAGQYLLQLGHRRIGCIVGPSEITPSAGRLAGFKRALDEAGLALLNEAVVTGNFRYDGGAQAMNSLLERNLNLSAVFATNDTMAIGALNALRAAHLKVPDDISLIGFDNIPLSEAVIPTLTTIAQPIKEMGQLSVAMLLERIKNSTNPPKTSLLSTVLVERQSCGPYHKGKNMKKTGILHNQLSAIIASLGHTDMLVIADSALPVPAGVPCIDLAVTAGLPGFMEVVRAIAQELEAERLLVATELEARESSLPTELRATFPQAAFQTVSHEELKRLSTKAKAVVRTGEQTPYANVIICRGVTS